MSTTGAEANAGVVRSMADWIKAFTDPPLFDPSLPAIAWSDADRPFCYILVDR